MTYKVPTTSCSTPPKSFMNKEHTYHMTTFSLLSAIYSPGLLHGCHQHLGALHLVLHLWSLWKVARPAITHRRSVSHACRPQSNFEDPVSRRNQRGSYEEMLVLPQQAFGSKTTLCLRFLALKLRRFPSGP